MVNYSNHEPWIVQIPMWTELTALHDYVVPRLPPTLKTQYDGFSMEKIGGYLADFAFGGAMAL